MQTYDNKDALTNSKLGNSVPDEYVHRKHMAVRILERYSDRIPILVNKDEKAKCSALPHKRYIVPRDLVVAKFMRELRSILQLQSTHAIFLFVEIISQSSSSNVLNPLNIFNKKNKTVIPLISQTIGELYNKYRSDDYFLHFIYAEENAFG